MIALFDNRKPGTIFALVLLFLVAKTIVFAGTLTSDSVAMYADSAPFDLLIAGREWTFMLGSISLFLIGLVFNFYLNSSNLFSTRKNYLNIALFILMSSLVFQVNIFGKYTVLLLVLTVVYALLVSTSKPNKPTDIFFYLGIVTGVLVLLQHQLIIFIPFILIAANIVSVVSGPDLVKWMGGILAAGIWYFGFIFIFNPGESPFRYFDFNFSLPSFHASLRMNISMILIILYSLIFLYYTMNRITKLSFVHRKFMMMNMVLLGGSFMAVIFNGMFNTSSFILMLFPSVIFGSFNVLTISKKWNIDVIHYIFAALVILVNLVIP